MTAPAPHRRTTAAQRRAQRAEFKALRQRLAENPSLGMEAYRQQNRLSDARHKTREKIKRIAEQKTVQPFTARQLFMLKPAESAEMELYAKYRLMALSEEERANVRRNLHLLLVLLGPEDWRAFISYGASP